MIGAQVDDILGLKGTKIDAARTSLDECNELSETNEYHSCNLWLEKNISNLTWMLLVGGGDETCPRLDGASGRDIAKESSSWAAR